MAEITKEMIDAGARALTECDLLNDPYSEVAPYIFEAMDQVRSMNNNKTVEWPTFDTPIPLADFSMIPLKAYQKYRAIALESGAAVADAALAADLVVSSST